MDNQNEILLNGMRRLRRASLREFVVNSLAQFVNLEFGLTQLAALLLLDEQSEITIKQLAEYLSRSVSTTSRLVDQLVECAFVARREAEHDRRAKLVAITEAGRHFLARLEQTKANAQLRALEQLSPEEQELVLKAMTLLAETSFRSNSHE